MKLTFFRTVFLGALIALWLSRVEIVIPVHAQADDVRNGWYPQLPAISRAEVQQRITCVSKALGVPLRTAQIVDLPLVNPLSSGPGLAPAEIEWEWADGRTWRSTAILTGLWPKITYVEAARHLGVTPSPTFACEEGTGPVMVTLQRSPIGPARDCPGGSGVCFQALGDGEDPLREGAVYTRPDGTRLQKKQAGWFFVRFLYWQAL